MYHSHVIHVRAVAAGSWRLTGQRTVFAKRPLRTRNDRPDSPGVITVAMDRGGEESRDTWAWHRRHETGWASHCAATRSPRPVRNARCGWTAHPRCRGIRAREVPGDTREGAKADHARETRPLRPPGGHPHGPRSTRHREISAGLVRAIWDPAVLRDVRAGLPIHAQCAFRPLLPARTRI